MSRDRAAYMRAYRAKERSTPSPGVEGPNLGQDLEACREEVARLKRLLAERPDKVGRAQDSSPRVVDAETRRARQAVIDTALAKVNRTGRK